MVRFSRRKVLVTNDDRGFEVALVQYSVLINGIPKERIQARVLDKGILFLLLVYTGGGVEGDIIEGFEVGLDKVSVSSLIF